MASPFYKSFFISFLLFGFQVDGLWAMGGAVPAGYPNTFLMGMVSNYFPDVNNEYGYGVNAQVYTLNTWEGPVGGSSFDMSYRYLNGGYYSGGTTGGNGWSNSALGAGYVLKHHADLCKQYNYDPVFIYYQIGNEALGEGGTSPNDAVGMGLYYQDWTYTMYLIDQWITANTTAGYTPVVTVDLEPDFSGSVEQNNLYAGFGPANFGMNVANCTVPSPILAAPGCPAWVPLTGYANNFQGYCAAVLHIKDQVVSAANKNRVHIAFHVSSWATNGNPAANTGYPYPLTTVAAHALTIANFVNACQPAAGSQFDLFFNDPSGYDGHNPVVGGPPNVYDWGTGGVVGMADQYAYFLNQISTLTNLRGMLWQMPLGNSKMSDTNGHYKDERPEYFLADSPLNDQGYAHNICQYMNAGIIGILWGAGSITSSTSVEDMLYSSWTEDGTANGGSGSWTTPAVIDNDGGFMRSHAANAHLWASQCGVTNTPTNSATATATSSSTYSATCTATSTATRTPTASSTMTATSSPTNSATVTYTPTVSATATVTQSATFTETPTITSTTLSSVTATVTNSVTASGTPTPTNAATGTDTLTSTATVPNVPTATLTNTSTASTTMASTATFTLTETSTTTLTSTDTPHPLNTASSTSTQSYTFTATSTASMTMTTTALWTATWSATPDPVDFFVSKNVFSPGLPVLIKVSFNQGPGSYELSVYNSAGEHIVQLAGEKVEGAYSKIYSWDGKNKYGSLCASGVYVIRLSEPMQVRKARIVFIR